MDCQQHEQRLKEIEEMLIRPDEEKAKILERLAELEKRIDEIEKENKKRDSVVGALLVENDELQEENEALLDQLKAANTPYGED